MKNICVLLVIILFGIFVIATESKNVNNVIIGEAVATTMPCCSETMGHSACQEIATKKNLFFRNRCKTDADFGMIQCCKSCKTNIVELGKELFEGGIKSKHCFDRHNKKFCTQFLQQTEMWGGNGNQMSCNGDSGALAFRICRRTCGFCNVDLYEEEKYPRTCPKSPITNTRHTFMEPLPTIIFGQR